MILLKVFPTYVGLVLITKVHCNSRLNNESGRCAAAKGHQNAESLEIWHF